MEANDRDDALNLWEYGDALWKSKWWILVPTFAAAAIAGILSFMKTPVWEVDALFQPSKMLIQTQDGKFEEVLMTDPNQIASEINQDSFSSILASELNIDPVAFPKIQAANIRNTKIIRIAVRVAKPDQGKRILESLYAHLISQLNRKIDVELKSIDTRIGTLENSIRQNGLAQKDKESDARVLESQKARIREEIASEDKRRAISEQRIGEIRAEMKATKERIDDFESRWKKVLGEQKQGSDAVLMLLYSNEAQTNLRYMNSLEENLGKERITEETALLNKMTKAESIRELDAQTEKQRNEIERLKNSMEEIKKQIDLLREHKSRIDPAGWIKTPASSPGPVAPNKRKSVMFAGLAAFLAMCVGVLLLDSFKKSKLGPSK
jgi:capsular polysaccharide biosynthesis protein